ncbi:hypothetical protein TYRP_011470 [Tyrophagus putrescentiae]|nr:hypothetical protein TYRP_011470 [Tyrophagus putrescentiae]
MSASSATTTTFGGGREEDHCWRWRRWQWSTTERRQVAHLDERRDQHLTQNLLIQKELYRCNGFSVVDEHIAFTISSSSNNTYNNNSSTPYKKSQSNGAPFRTPKAQNQQQQQRYSPNPKSANSNNNNGKAFRLCDAALQAAQAEL